MTVILMSRSEIDRMNVLRDLAEERIRVSEAATLMGLGCKIARNSDPLRGDFRVQ